ncbi:hypothetical protein B9Z55_022305 [Caenorhabditis nigoni]|uniref:SXP/RAL-2 family protein Ani s 5-like cation-binding domain-containing protein n=1 Tax=Caenorhabditis nigoni TaxID=1611254 RepID=A0A2G5SK23_9PELO|nr:hypothetical protein B9Z55_022305 [Caenorhabditis nigoni]
MRWEELTFLLLLISGTNAQFGEIASLATSLLGGALGNGAGIGALAGAGAAGAGAAGQAGGALAQIGQLYQLAQGALQLTGTGVGVLNQASEGNWFPAVLEQTAKNSQALMKQGGGNGLNLGALGPAPGKTASGGIGPEFGTSFPAPNIDDYDENAEIPGVTEKKSPKAPDGLVDIEDEDYEIETTPATTTTTETTTTTVTTTLIPDESEEEITEPTTPPPRQIRIQLPDKDGKAEPEEELDYEDLINKKAEKSKPLIPTIDAESTDEIKRNVIATHGAKTQPVVPKLDKLVEVLQKSKLSKEEIDEIVAQVEGNRHIEKPAKYDFNAAVQNIPDKKNTIRQKITDASRIINSNFENQRKEQSIVIQKQVDEFKVFPDLTNSNVASHLTTHKPTTTTATTTKATTTTSPNISPTVVPASSQATMTTPKSIPTTPITQKHVQQTRSVPQGAPPPASQVVRQVAPQPQVAAPFLQPHPQQPYNNLLLPQNHFQHPFHHQQQTLYYTQVPLYGQQTQNYWGQQQNQYNQQYGLHPNQQQQQQQNFQQPQLQQTGYSTQQPQPLTRVQPQQQQQQQYYSQVQQQVQRPQAQPQQPQQQQYHQQYNQQFIPQQPREQPPASVQQRIDPPAPSQQVVYRQGNAHPTAAPPKPVYPQGNVNQVVHYYNDGQQIVQQIIPKRIAANGNLPLSGPFQYHSVTSVDPAEYEKRQKVLRQAYQQPHTRSAETQGNVRVQPSARVQPRIYESTVTATGHRQAHAIRTYQATKSVSVTPPNPQPAAVTRSSGRVSAAKKRYSGHVLPGPTIDHRSLLEKRTTSKPRYVRMP